ncbi:hypothetical protein JCM10212_003949 [Sporobolomyces blumeae]
MTPRAEAGGGPSLVTARPALAASTLATPPSSQSPPELDSMADAKEHRDAIAQGKVEDAAEAESGATSRSPLDDERSGDVDAAAVPTLSHSPLPISPESTSASFDGPALPDVPESEPQSSITAEIMPADLLDSALQSHSAQPPPEALYPSPASTLRPPPATEGDASITSDLSKRIDDRIARAKDKDKDKDRAKPPKLDMASLPPPLSGSDAASARDSLPTPTSPALAPRPGSRPSSRPPSISRHPSSYRSPSASSSSRGGSHQAGIDPKRLSVSSSVAGGSGSGLASPRLTDGTGGLDLYNPEHGSPLANSHSKIPPSPLGPSRRESAMSITQLLSPSDSAPPPPPAEPSASKPEPNPWDAPVTIRDYAYPKSDPRHVGLPHPDGPKAKKNKKKSRRFGHFRRPGEDTSEDEDDDDDDEGPGADSDDEDEREAERRQVSWGFVTSHSTDFPASSPASSSAGDPPSGYSFHDTDDYDRSLYYSRAEQEAEEARIQAEIERELGLGEFVPGVYQALYEFVPELETEMKLNVGEWVNVFERQCAGWVQAGRIVDGVLTEEVGLVPENYLERFEYDEGAEADHAVDSANAKSKTEQAGDEHDWKRIDGSDGKTVQDGDATVEATDAKVE